MFRSQQSNAFDEPVARATDENLTSENWELILNVCDKVADAPSGPKDAVAAVIKRLGHRNANVQLYTLELANALSQNCGVPLHRELASRSFTEALLRLAGDRNTHQKVKTKILERMMDWTEMFGKNPELGIMEQAYMRLKTQNPHLQPPSQPPKTLITDSDKRREEEELQMALALSIKEKDKQKQSVSSGRQNGHAGGAQQSQQGSSRPQNQAVASGTTAATVSRVRALYDFTPSEPGELAFRKGDVIAVLESVYKDWWKGSLRGQKGIFPLNYVEKLQDPTQDELEREAHMEAEVFGEIKNVEKLLALLSTSAERGKGDVRDNEEITTLYHSTLAIRPKLIELIGKYSQKKDDFTQLNEKFIKARRDYETLIEASMSNAGRPAYNGRPYQQYGGPPQQDPYQHQHQQQQQQQQHQYQQQPPPAQAQQQYYPQAPQEQPYQQPQQQPPNGPHPFYFVPPNQSAQPGRPLAQHDNASVDDLYAATPRPNTNIRPASIAFDPRQQRPPATAQGPQELATGSFDTPTPDGRHPFYQAQPPPSSVSLYQGAPPSNGSDRIQSPYGQHYAPSAPELTLAHRPASPYSQQQQQQQQQQQPPAQQFYSQPAQSHGRLPSAPSDGYPQQYPPQQPIQQMPPQAAPSAPPSSTSPVHTQHAPPQQQQQQYASQPPQQQAPVQSYAPPNVSGTSAPIGYPPQQHQDPHPSSSTQHLPFQQPSNPNPAGPLLPAGTHPSLPPPTGPAATQAPAQVQQHGYPGYQAYNPNLQASQSQVHIQQQQLPPQQQQGTEWSGAAAAP